MPYEYHAVAVEVHDGDTFKATVDLGFRLYMRMQVRIEDLFMPELGDPQGPAARKALEDILVVDGKPAPLILRSRKAGETMSFTRYVFEVYRVERDGSLTDVATIMAAGFGRQGRGT